MSEASRGRDIWGRQKSEPGRAGQRPQTDSDTQTDTGGCSHQEGWLWKVAPFTDSARLWKESARGWRVQGCSQSQQQHCGDSGFAPLQAQCSFSPSFPSKLSSPFLAYAEAESWVLLDSFMFWQVSSCLKAPSGNFPLPPSLVLFPHPCTSPLHTQVTDGLLGWVEGSIS